MNRSLPYLFIALAGALLFFHSLGTVSLFDWDEINFAESAREMIESGNYMRVQINYEPFWEKPPFFFWLQSVSMQVFGVGEMAARLPNALCGIVTLLVLYAIGIRLHNKRMAAWWVFIYAASFLPHLYFKSGIIDPWFNLFIFISIYFLSRFISSVSGNEKQKKILYFSAFFAGMAIITKGPVALLVILLTYLVFYFLKRKTFTISLIDYVKWGLAMSAVTLLWFGLEVAQHGWWFVNEFITYQIRLAKTEDAGHGGFLLYHFVVLLIGCFPASIFMWGPKINEEGQQNRQSIFRIMMIASLGVILVVFTLVQTKIIHYSSFAYLPIGYLAAVNVERLINNKIFFTKWQLVLFLIIGTIWGIAFTLLPLIGNNPDWIRPFLSQDPFAAANLEADVKWGFLLIVPGILFLFSVWFAWAMFKKNKRERGFIILIIASICAMQVLLTLFAPRIEQYSQRAAIDFFKSIRGKQVYVATVGYKSYAPYFYAEVGEREGVLAKPADWILSNQLDRPAYLVSKITDKERLMNDYPALRFLYEKNGFVFFEKLP
jgi:4-amino-4-deoxy-L-arabinose transferase-like glycosyltransferase